MQLVQHLWTVHHIASLYIHLSYIIMPYFQLHSIYSQSIGHPIETHRDKLKHVLANILDHALLYERILKKKKFYFTE